MLYHGNGNYPGEHRQVNDLIYADIRMGWLQIYVSNNHSNVGKNSAVFDTQSDSTSFILLEGFSFLRVDPPHDHGGGASSFTENR